jgi:hypothetical protein
MCCTPRSFPVVKLAKTWFAIGLVISVIPFSQVALAASAPAQPAASATVPANPESMGITIFWAGAALFACAAVAGGIILARKLHQQKALVAAGGVDAPAPQKTFSLPSNGNGSKSNGSKPFRFNHRPAKTPKLVNNHANGNGNAKRRRMFNYHKFYTEMVLQGPSPSTVADNAYNPYAGYYVEYETPRINNGNGNGSNGNGNGANGSHNGNSNGNGNGNGNGHHDSNGHAADLLATQKSLIQNQQRLIDEQARLIEEKSRLIAEKNQILERQTQMLDNNLL